MDAFRGFEPSVREWFLGLEAENTRAYFARTRSFYEVAIREQMHALLAELADRFGGEVKLFRQHRDVRFSRDKSPYKTNTYGILRGSPHALQGLYASISASGLVAGSGYHVMTGDQLERYREAVADDRRGPELERRAAAAEAAGLELWSARLATAPRGCPRDHPRIDLLRRKSLALGATLPFGRGAGIDREAGLRFVADTWSAAAPVTAWLDAHVGAASVSASASSRR